MSLPNWPGSNPIFSGNGKIAGMIVRRQELLRGTLEIETWRLRDGLYKIAARVRNQSFMEPGDLENSETVLKHTFVSAHIILQAEHGEFVSLLETPAEFKEAAGGCRNIGVWPVLVGDEAKGERATMLASPIILYDYPKVAPESAGDFGDGTEIDEMLTLRVMTMTEAEKREMHADDFARKILGYRRPDISGAGPAGRPGPGFGPRAAIRAPILLSGG